MANDGATALIEAARNGKENCVRLLLGGGADVNSLQYAREHSTLCRRW